MDALSRMLTVADARVLKLVLDMLKRIFEVGVYFPHDSPILLQTAEEYNQLESCCLALENCGALNLLEHLQDHQNEEVYVAAYNFISRFFNDGVSIGIMSF